MGKAKRLRKAKAAKRHERRCAASLASRTIKRYGNTVYMAGKRFRVTKRAVRRLLRKMDREAEL